MKQKPDNETNPRTPSTLLEALEKWHEDDQFQDIIDAIEALPKEQQTPELISQLARAYNNLAEPGDRHLFKKALELLKAVEEEYAGEHNWNYRMGYALYYLDQESRAKYYFEKALEYRPGDEDTLEMISLCRKVLALPNAMKPFCERVKEGWQSFLEGEWKLRQMLDAKQGGEPVADLCHQLLSPAFAGLYFEVGCNGGRYDLILSPEGDKSRIFKLIYFMEHAPKEVHKNWNILVGRHPANGFVLRMYDRDIGTEDARVWVEELEDKQIGLSIYCEKLLPLLKENENQAYSLMSVLLDQAIGEIPAIRYVGYMNLLEAPQEGEDICLEDLLEYIKKDRETVTADQMCHWYSAYEMKPSEKEEWDLREDVYAGVTTCLPVVSAYYRGDDGIMEDFHQDGAVPAFFYYTLEGIPRNQILDLRDKLEQKISEKCGDAVVFTGGATGTEFGYLDFIAWNLTAVLDAAVEVFRNQPVKEALFHTFRRNVGSIWIKKEEA